MCRRSPTKRAVYPASTSPGLDASGEGITRSSPVSPVSASSRMHSQFHLRHAMIVPEDHLAVVRTAGNPGQAVHDRAGPLAQVAGYVAVPRGDGDADALPPLR